MSDSDSSSSSDEDLELHEGESKTVVNPVRKLCFFLTETGHSLNFILLVDNMTESEVTEITNLIQLHMGTVSTSKKDVGSYSAVLVADKATSWDYSGDVFRLTYIHDCIAAGKLLNIAEYLKDPPSKQYVENFDYMSVIYHRKYSWSTIPPIYKFKPAESHTASPDEDCDSDSSVDSLKSFGSTCPFPVPQSNKHTNSLYTHAEKEAMLRYVVERKMYGRVKGKLLYKEMEAANICPIRTWQSMQYHFTKQLSKELPRFAFLTEHQRKKLQDALGHG